MNYCFFTNSQKYEICDFTNSYNCNYKFCWRFQISEYNIPHLYTEIRMFPTNPLTVTIMAAGEGKRMNSTLPKVLHKVGGIPILLRILGEVLKLGPENIIIVTGKHDLLIYDTIYRHYRGEIPVSICFVKQEEPRGTGDAIRSTLDFYADNEQVLILNGDMPLITHRLLQDFIATNEKASLMMAHMENPQGYGRILLNDSKKCHDIREEKDCSPEERGIKTVNVGIYSMEAGLLRTCIPEIKNENKQGEYYLTDIVRILHEKTGKIWSTYQVYDEQKYQIMGVNTQAELEELERRYL